MRRIAFFVAVAVGGASAALAGDGFNAQHFEPPIDPFGYVTAQGTKPLEPLQLHFAPYYNGSHEPLLIAVDDVGQAAAIRDLHWMDFVLGLGVVPVGDGGLSVGIDLPVAIRATGSDPIDADPFETARMGDLRTDAKLVLLDRDESALGIGFRAWVDWPTGAHDRFISNDGKLAAGGEAFVEKRIELVRFALGAGVEWIDGRFRSPLATFDDQLRASAAVAVAPFHGDRALGGLEVVGELTHRTQAKRPWDGEALSPIEGTVAVRYEGRYYQVFRHVTTPSDIELLRKGRMESRVFALLGGGAGLNEGVGAPDWRLIAAVGFMF